MKATSDIGQDQPAKASKPLIKSIKKVRSPPFFRCRLDGSDFCVKWRVTFCITTEPQPANEGTNPRKKHRWAVPQAQDHSVSKHRRQFDPHRLPGQRRRAAFRSWTTCHPIYELWAAPDQRADFKTQVSNFRAFAPQSGQTHSLTYSPWLEAACTRVGPTRFPGDARLSRIQIFLIL